MMRRVVTTIAGLAFGAGLGAQGFQQGPPLTPAETLLERVVLRAIVEAPGNVPADVIKGADPAAGEIWLTCNAEAAGASGCPEMQIAAGKLRWLIEEKGLERPARTVRFVQLRDGQGALKLARESPAVRDRRVPAAIHLGRASDIPAELQIVRTPWSHASIADEVAEVVARQPSDGSSRTPLIDSQPFRDAGQPRFDGYDVPTLALVGTGAPASLYHVGFVAAASAYFLATLPNAGSEALLSHLTVGAHARLADDGRRVVAQMGLGQRPSGDVLSTIAQAIEREQRRFRSFERFVPSPIDPTLDARLTAMEKGITSVWTSLAMSSAPFTPTAQRIRGRGGEDRRVPARAKESRGPLDPGSTQLALSKIRSSSEVGYEIVNFIDGRRSISDIRDAVSAEFGNVPLTAVVEYVELLAKAGVLSIK